MLGPVHLHQLLGIPDHHVVAPGKSVDPAGRGRGWHEAQDHATSLDLQGLAGRDGAIDEGQPDTDGDGSCNASDLCIGNDATGDTDGDGIGNACDACDNDANNDTDGDGVCDDVDAVPNSRDVGSTIHIGGCDTGVPNAIFPNGTTISDSS